VAVLALILRFYLIRLNNKVESTAEYEMVGISDEGIEAENALMGSAKIRSQGREGFRFML